LLSDERLYSGYRGVKVGLGADGRSWFSIAALRGGHRCRPVPIPQPGGYHPQHPLCATWARIQEWQERHATTVLGTGSCSWSNSGTRPLREHQFTGEYVTSTRNVKEDGGRPTAVGRPDGRYPTTWGTGPQQGPAPNSQSRLCQGEGRRRPRRGRPRGRSPPLRRGFHQLKPHRTPA